MTAAPKLEAVPPVADTATVHQAIAAVIADLPAIGKDDRITEGPQRYAYRGIETIKAELKPVLAKHGVHYAPFDITQVTDSTYETQRGGTWQRVRMVVRYRIYGPAGDCIEAVGRGEGADNSDKACNKAMTVAEKQMLIQVFCIANGERDPDHSRAEEQAAPAPVLVTPAGLKGALASVLGSTDAAKEWWEANNPGEGPWPQADADRIIGDAKRSLEDPFT